MRSHVALWVQREHCESRRVAGYVGGRPGKRGRYEAGAGQHGRPLGPSPRYGHMGTAGPIEQEAVHLYAYMHGNERDVDDSSGEEEEEEKGVGW